MRSRRASRRPNRSTRPLILEVLEGRCLPSTVTNLNDSGPGSLRQAIADTPPTGTVDFQDGLTGTITLTSATLTINKILTIEGPGADVITVSGNHALQVFTIPAPFTVTISGLTIANGNGGGPGGISVGGALTLTDSTLSGNTGSFGGAIYTTGNLTVINSNFSGNSAIYFGGGAILNDHGTLVVTDSTFGGNSATDDNGGGIENSGNATISSSWFSNNSQTRGGGAGGGIYNSGTLTLNSDTLNGNHTVGVGGGIYNAGSLTIYDSTFSNNSASSNGGGIQNDGGGALNVYRSTFNVNSAASSGGGIGNTSSSNVAIGNCTFNLNAAVNGAGIADTGNGALSLTHSTLSGNIASNQGGGIFHSGTGRLNFLNTIVAGNRAFMPSADVQGPLNSQGYNLIGNGTGGSGFDVTDLVGTAATPIDPMLGPLQDNGGFALPHPLTMAVLPGSPALNAGDPDELGINDERIVPRTGGTTIGAYQASASVFNVTAVDSIQAGTPFDVTVAAYDVFGQPAYGYTGTVTFSSADPFGATVPADFTFQASDQGSVTFFAGAALYTSGTWDITATDSDAGFSGTVNVQVTPAAAVQFVVTAPSQATPGMPFDVTIMAVDPYGNIDTNYQGTVAWTSTDTDSRVVLPGTYTFTLADAGVHVFTNPGSGQTTLFTPGDQTITVMDTADSSIVGMAIVTVSGTAPGPGQHATHPAADSSGVPEVGLALYWSTRHDHHAAKAALLGNWLDVAGVLLI